MGSKASHLVLVPWKRAARVLSDASGRSPYQILTIVKANMYFLYLSIHA
jgi:hypothetical protein